MKIVLYVNTFLPHVGGRELVVHHLALAFKGLGHQVRVVGPSSWWRTRGVKYEYPVHRYPTFAGRKSLAKPGIKARLREAELLLQLAVDLKIWGCDIIHAHTTHPSGYIATRLKKKGSQTPVIITPHGIDIHQIPEIGHGKRLNPFLQPKIEQVLQDADALTAISGSIRASLLDAGANPNKIYQIPNGVDIKRFQQKTNTDVRKSLSLPEDARLIVTVGNYNPRKGHEVLINTMPSVLKQEPRAKLVIVGRGTNVLNSLVQKLGLNDSVLLLGEVKLPAKPNMYEGGDRLVDIYRNSSVYVSAGIEEGAEGLSLAVLEAMASGLPIIGTDVSGNRDIILNGENGFLVPPSDSHRLSDKILEILKNNHVQNEMGDKALQTVQDFSWEKIATMYLELYKQMSRIQNA